MVYWAAVSCTLAFGLPPCDAHHAAHRPCSIPQRVRICALGYVGNHVFPASAHAASWPKWPSIRFGSTSAATCAWVRSSGCRGLPQLAVTLFLQSDLPNVLAFVRLFLSTLMFFLLVHLRPYVHPSTFWVDVVCYVCLIAQFGLQTMVADRDFLGVAAAQSDSFAAFFRDISTLSTVFR